MYEPEGLAGLARDLPTGDLALGVLIAEKLIEWGQDTEVSNQRRLVFLEELVRRGALPSYGLVTPA